jgi:A/G-specific adenine glycosylase
MLPSRLFRYYTKIAMNMDTAFPLEPPFGDYTGVSFLDDDEIRRFREVIYTYYGGHGRSFPWRESRNPYRILVSEIMLQQTQTERVLPKYERFISVIPDFTALSQATLLEVYTLWKGLGYNRRAKALIDIAKTVERDFAGVLPDGEGELEKLPMIGPATAAAVRAFAHEIPTAYLETNMRRVYIHFFFEGRTDVRDAELLPLAKAALDPREPRQWQYALMDYGVFLKNVLPNPNRRSRHHTVQSSFEGSDRQIRGEILQFLARHEASPVENIFRGLAYEKTRIARSLKKLEADGMLVKESTVYRIENRES